MTGVLLNALDAYNYVILAYFIILTSTYLWMTIVAYRHLPVYAYRLRSLDIQDLLLSAAAPPVTIVAPAYNEEATCVDSVRSLLTLDYPEYEILVVNDGSKDNTLPALKDAFDLVPASRFPTAKLGTAAINGIYQCMSHPNLWVIDKQNGGKADALNVGINHCVTPFFCAIDADSLLEGEALMRIVRPFIHDHRTVAAGGMIRIANGCAVRAGEITQIQLPRNLLARFQVVEYFRAFFAGRVGLSENQLTLIISGAFGLFRRQEVADAGGFASARTSGETVGEDMELVVRLHRHCREHDQPYRVTFVPDPAAWTECPESLRILGRQRDRWQRGLYESLMRHRKMLLNPRYGRVGLFAFPYFFFLELWGPLIELTGYVTFAIAVGLGRASSAFIVTFTVAAVVLGFALSVAAIGLEELTFRRYERWRDFFHQFLLALLENLGYRQLSVCWRVRGIWSALRKKGTWGKMERKGFTVQAR